MPGGSGTVVITSGGGESKPKGIIDALSEIEKFSAMDRKGSEIPERFFTTKNRIEYFEAGFKGSLVSGLVSALLAPMAIGVPFRQLARYVKRDVRLTHIEISSSATQSREIVTKRPKCQDNFVRITRHQHHPTNQTPRKIFFSFRITPRPNEAHVGLVVWGLGSAGECCPKTIYVLSYRD